MLSIVPTPIGNLGDITLRALEILHACDLVAAEDTRHTGILLKHHGISKPQVSLHEHNEASRSADLVQRMLGGLHVALVSDAGTPGISDPGLRLIRETRQAGIPMEVLPGPCAAITALVGSGFDTSSFTFGGFLPNKSGRRARILAEALDRPHTSIFYESPHRILKSLEALHAIDPACEVCVARELTKHFEENLNGTPAELLAHFQTRPPKGEFCLLLAGKDARAKTPARHQAEEGGTISP
ncbi:MAG: 16S rRNA (cytidine(1402)-2'-O)-methyltransferase [Terrimicrobiaceae bacterium]